MNDATTLMLTDLRWVASHSASCFHAADWLRRGRRLEDAVLAEALLEPVARLQQDVRALGLDETAFWSQLVPLSAGIENNTQLAEQVVRKLVGNNERARTMVSPLAGRIADVEAAVHRAVPDLVEQLATWADPFERRWQESGMAILQAVGYLTDVQFLVPNADVILVPAVAGGDGAAHLPYNSVRIEVLESDPVPSLPEVIRLAWLVSQLNLDLPKFSEMIPGDRLPLVAQLAMLPATLEAAAELKLCSDDPLTVQLALESWHIEGPPGIDLADVVTTWWDSHLELRPAWNVSLGALDRMIEGS